MEVMMDKVYSSLDSCEFKSEVTMALEIDVKMHQIEIEMAIEESEMLLDSKIFNFQDMVRRLEYFLPYSVCKSNRIDRHSTKKTSGLHWSKFPKPKWNIWACIQEKSITQLS